MNGWYRSSEFKTLASNKENNSKLKGLLISSYHEILYTIKDHLEEILTSFVIKDDDTFLTQLDTIGCDKLNNYENILEDYDILFIGQYVKFPEKMIDKLKDLISLKKIAIIFLNSNNNYLANQLNYLKLINNYNYDTEIMYQLNLNVVLKCNSLQKYYFKFFYNSNKENNDEEWTLVDLKENYSINFNNINPQSVIDLNNWYPILKIKDNFIVLLHKQDKVLFSHWTGYFETSQISIDLFYYLVNYLLFEYKSEEDKFTVFKKKLFVY